MLRRLTVNVFLALTSIVVTITLLEVGLRLFYPQGGQPVQMYEFDPKLGHRNVPNLDFSHIWGGHEGVSRIRTGPMGFRDAKVSVLKETHEFRLLLLGDSYTFGYGVDGQSTFAKRLERNLGNIPEHTRRFTVINAGVSGYGTAQEMLQYELKGRQFDPDLVILSIFVGNDIQDNLCLNLKTLTPHHRAPCFVVEGQELVAKLYPLPVSNDKDQERPSFSLADVLSSTEFYKLLRSHGQTLVIGNPWTVRFLKNIGIYIHPGYLPHVVEGWYRPDNVKLGLPLTQKLLMRLNREVEKTGARLAVVLIPSRIQVLPGLLKLSEILYPDIPEIRAFFEDPHKPQRLLVNFLHEKNIPVLDLLPLLKNHPNTDNLYLPVNAHWNELGHALAAEAIEEFLRSEQLIPELGD